MYYNNYTIHRKCYLGQYECVWQAFQKHRIACQLRCACGYEDKITSIIIQLSLEICVPIFLTQTKTLTFNSNKSGQQQSSERLCSRPIDRFGYHGHTNQCGHTFSARCTFSLHSYGFIRHVLKHQCQQINPDKENAKVQNKIIQHFIKACKTFTNWAVF